MKYCLAVFCEVVWSKWPQYFEGVALSSAQYYEIKNDLLYCFEEDSGNSRMGYRQVSRA